MHPAHHDYLQTAMRAEEWLLIEWPEGEKEPAKYFLSTAPEYASLEQLVFVAKSDKRIERDYQDIKQDFGLGHFEGRGWRGFHHHATLSIAAYGFLMARRLERGGSGEADIKKNFAQRHVPDSITTLRILLSIELIRALGHYPHCHAVNQQLNL